jgi:hypothetical protein
VLRQEVAGYAMLLSEAATAVREVRPESLFAADRAIASGNDRAEQSIGWASEVVQRWAHSMRDHVELIERALAPPRLLLLPAWTAARVVLESALMTCWLLDAQVSSHMRIARATALVLGTPQGNADMHRRIGEHDERAVGLATLGEMAQDYEQAGFEVVWSLDRQRRARDDKIAAVRFGDARASLNPNMTQLGERYLPRDAHLYGLLSGASHSEPWLLSDFDAGSVDNALWAVMAPLTPTSDAYTTAICRYFAIDAEPYMRKRRFREMVLFRAVRGDS